MTGRVEVEEVVADVLFVCMCVCVFVGRREVYRQLRSIYPHLACRQFLEALQQLEKECGYGEERIPQLREVSAFLRGEAVSAETSTGIRSSFLSVWVFASSCRENRFSVTSGVRLAVGQRLPQQFGLPGVSVHAVHPPPLCSHALPRTVSPTVFSFLVP